jgi:predicted NBD/HSP70 family sugar kinase
MRKTYDTLRNLSNESKRVFDLIQKKGPISKNSLQKLTKLKLTTLNRVMQPLEASHLIVQAGIEESIRGRKPVLYDVNRSRDFMIGVAITRTYVQVIVSNFKLEILGQVCFPMDQSLTPLTTSDRIAAAIEGQLAELRIATDQVIGVGVGAIGPLDRKKGVILNPRKFPAPGWLNTPIRDLLEEKTHLPVIVDIGVNMAALAEYFWGCGGNPEKMAYINCGIGIMSGFIASGAIVRTTNDAEDTLGHMIIDVDGERCDCGNFGCIECYASIPSIVGRFSAELKKGRNSKITKPPEAIDYRDVCGLAESNDGLAREVISNAATILGTGLANYINLLNPGLVVISGPLVKHSKLFFSVATEVAQKKCIYLHENRISFKREGFFGDNAIAIGAAALVMERIIGSIEC